MLFLSQLSSSLSLSRSRRVPLWHQSCSFVCDYSRLSKTIKPRPQSLSRSHPSPDSETQSRSQSLPLPQFLLLSSVAACLSRLSRVPTPSPITPGSSPEALL
ncbi:uncharacterized protein LOC133717427 [Rosa rugosa]|uniref:uncharacterized protein LOC133717427 n=1 Tax=Rosa rugosa TaxID=74645 RepID=UPI002B40BB76|nr:uncharacterized protein LOC133717427 [Rosa rugosa]